MPGHAITAAGCTLRKLEDNALGKPRCLAIGGMDTEREGGWQEVYLPGAGFSANTFGSNNSIAA